MCFIKVARRDGCIIAKLKSYEPNETILGDGVEVPNFVYFVLSGRCQMIESLNVEIINDVGKKRYKLHDDYVSSTLFLKRWKHDCIIKYNIQ